MGVSDGWRGIVPRLGSGCSRSEQLALEVFQESVAYYAKLQEDGKIERFDAYLMEPHGGDLAGFFMIHGDRSALDTVRSSPQFQRVVVRAGSVVDNLGVVSASGGDALAQQMGLFGASRVCPRQGRHPAAGGRLFEPPRRKRRLHRSTPRADIDL